MSLLILNVDGETLVQAVGLDDPTPSYAEYYAERIAEHLPAGTTLRWTLVDVTRVSDYGPNGVAEMLREDTLGRIGVLDLPQRWETLKCGGELPIKGA